MLTKKQRELLLFINDRIKESGVSPSFDEMKEALWTLPPSPGIHRLITALEERGFLRRLAHRARALEVLKAAGERRAAGQSAVHALPAQPSLTGDGRPARKRMRLLRAGSFIPVMGRIAAGTAIEAIEHETHQAWRPRTKILIQIRTLPSKCSGESMINAGILDGDIVIVKKTDTAVSGDIVVALINEETATLKRFRKKGGSIALEAANPAFGTQIFGPDHVKIQGKLVALVRRYH